jgi:integrase
MQVITDAIDNVMSFLREIPLSDYSINAYLNCYKAIDTYCENNNISLFSYDVAATYIEQLQTQRESGKISKKRHKFLRRAAKLLENFFQDGRLEWKYYNYNPVKLQEQFSTVLSSFSTYLLSLDYSPGSMRVILSPTKQFLSFLENQGIYCTMEITDEYVKHFLVMAAPNNKGNMTNLIWSLKNFIVFLNKSNLSTVNADKYLQTPKARQNKLLPCFTDHEVDSILATVDISTIIGKRDYAVIKLATGLGLRGYDVFSMKLLDIDWRGNEISVLQSKTGMYVQLPLLPDVGNAIMDYILNARPKSNSPYIFLRCQKPYTKLGGHGNGTQIMGRILSKAGIQHMAWDGKTFHAFRRTRGTSLVKAGTPLPLVAQVLGHNVIDSTKRYVSLNDDMLRICCLDISKFSTRKDGLK